MAKPKIDTPKDGNPLHYSVGAVIESKGKYLLIDRALPPYGWAGIAGHLGEGEEPDRGIIRKVKEESGLEVITKKLLFTEEIPWNTCKEGINRHIWRVYECKIKGEVNIDKQGAKSYGWISSSYLPMLRLEPVWEYWFKKLGIIYPSRPKK